MKIKILEIKNDAACRNGSNGLYINKISFLALSVKSRQRKHLFS